LFGGYLHIFGITQEIWQTNLAPNAGTTHPVWGGTLADLLLAANSNPDIPSAFTFSGNNLWQAGVNTHSFGILAGSGIDDFNAFRDNSWPAWKSSRAEAWNKMETQQSAV
jgi:hypothetical protein